MLAGPFVVAVVLLHIIHLLFNLIHFLMGHTGNLKYR